MDNDPARAPPARHKRTARLFRNGRNQAVRLPREYEIQAEEVYIERAGETLVLTPKPQNWDAYFARARRLDADMPDQVEDMPPREPGAL
jgi:antitoxin VapB